MEAKAYCGEYVAPEINVIEIKGLGVLCASGYFDDDSQFNYNDNPGWFD